MSDMASEQQNDNTEEKTKKLIETIITNAINNNKKISTEELNSLSSGLNNYLELINLSFGCYTLLSAACCSNDIRLVEFLLERENSKCQIDINGGVQYGGIVTNPLCCAVMKGNSFILSLLIKKGANLNFIYPNGDNILHIAFRYYRDESTLEYLLSSMMEFTSITNIINIRNLFNKTPIDLAAGNNNVEAVRF